MGTYLTGEESLSLEELKSMTFKLIDTLYFFSLKDGLFHKNLKPNNILMGDLQTPKLVDFFFGKVYQYNISEEQVFETEKWMSPDMKE